MKETDLSEAIEKADEILEYYYKNPDEGTAPSPPHENNLASLSLIHI